MGTVTGKRLFEFLCFIFLLYCYCILGRYLALDIVSWI